MTQPGQTDVLLAVVAVSLVLSVLGVGILFLRLHTLPERIAHRTHKTQVEIVAVLGLISLFTHQHIFWIAGLLLAFIKFPDVATPARRALRALETIAGIAPPASELKEEMDERREQEDALREQEKLHA